MSEQPPNDDVDERNHDALLRRAFDRLRGRIGESEWVRSPTPHTHLVAGFRALASQPHVIEDVASALTELPGVAHSVEMFFAMSARARSQDGPPETRTVLARGWFLGRWLPTFLVLDGPVRRFLNSRAFRRQNQDVHVMRDVRRFLGERPFIALRHAFAHWSFEWASDGDDSELVTHDDDEHATEHRLRRSEADAFHIITFAIVETLFDTFMRGQPARRVSVTPAPSEATNGSDADVAPAIPHSFDPTWKYIDEVHARTCRCEQRWSELEAVATEHRALSTRLHAGELVPEIPAVQGRVVDATEAFLFQAGLLSLLLFGSSEQPRVVARRRRLRHLLGIADGELAALASRTLRDAFAHMDERIDAAVAALDDHFVLNYFEAHRNEAVPLGRCLRTFNTAELRVLILGEQHDMRAIRDAVACVRDSLERLRPLKEEVDRSLVQRAR